MNKQKTNKVIVGLSGGVDSAVTAHLLLQQGHDVSGVYMQNWEADNDDPHCSATQDLADAKATCDHLGIHFQVVNFAKQYWDNVFQYCLDEFAAGQTPNPDIWCNKEIKFKVFLQHALSLGADYLATGHYAKIVEKNGQYELHQADDINKEQTYFLYTLGQHELSHALFPLSELKKPEVRKIAQEIGLSNAHKKDSTGICFIGERKFRDFLQEFLLGKPGDIISDRGALLGRHDGLMYYTFGQRKGLNIGGVSNAAESPWYVIDKNTHTNTLIVGQGHDHPRLFTHKLTCHHLHWVNKAPNGFPLHCQAKTRYRQSHQACTLRALSNDRLEVEFNEPQRAITPGQAIVFYCNTRCLGGATILDKQSGE